MAAPLLWTLLLSLKSNGELLRSTQSAFSPPYTLQNYTDILGHSAVFRWVLNSAIVSLGVTFGVLALSSLAGYSFARLRFPGRGVIFIVVLFGLAIPEQSVIIARHQMFSALNLHNTYRGLILPGLAAPFGVFLMTQYFRAIPRELEEAAALDGASRLKTFLRVILPLSLPAQATLGIFTFLSTWNDYWWPLISATDSDMYTLTVGVASSPDELRTNQRAGFPYGAGRFRQRADLDRLRDLPALSRRRRIARGRLMARATLALIVTGMLVSFTGCHHSANGQVQITLQRFFGACDAEYGTSTDVAAAEGECGIATTLINRFNADNPDIQVKVNIVYWPGYDQLSAELAAGHPPDLVTMHESVISDYSKRHLIMPLNEMLASVGVDPADSFTRAAREGVTRDGSVYALPFDTWAPLWHLNLNLLRAAGLMRDGDTPVLPSTVPEELLQQARQFTRATGKPYLIQSIVNDPAASARNLFTCLMQQNSDFFADPRRIKLTDTRSAANSRCSCSNRSATKG